MFEELSDETKVGRMTWKECKKKKAMEQNYSQLPWVQKLKKTHKEKLERLREAQKDIGDSVPLEIDANYAFLKTLNKVMEATHY